MPWASMTSRIYPFASLATIVFLPSTASATHSSLESCQVGRAQGIGLGNHGYQVHSGTEPLHNLDVEWLQSVPCWSNKIQTSMDPKINLVNTTRLLLLQHVGLVLVIKELNDWHPRVAIVDIIAKSGRVDDGKAD